MQHEKSIKDILTDDGNCIFLIGAQIQIICFNPTNNKLIPIINIPDKMRRGLLSATVLMDNKIYIMEVKNMLI